MKIFPSKANGIIAAPPSKSMAHRQLICASLTSARSKIENIDYSQDILATIDCLRELGSKIETFDNYVVVEGIFSKPFSLRDFSFHCRESGSTLRFIIALAMLIGNRSRFYGSEVLLNRPLSVFQKICKDQNIIFEKKDNFIEVEGKLKPSLFEIPGNISSQFITGLLFVLPLLEGDSKIILTDSIESRSYINMTMQVQKLFGVDVFWQDLTTIVIPGRQNYIASDTVVEGDYSNSAFFEALNTIEGNVSLTGLNEDSLQGDKVYKQMFKNLIEGTVKLDISDCPDLGPILFVVAAMHNGGIFTGTKRLSIKESNRGLVMCNELSKFGVLSKMEEDSISIIAGSLKCPSEIVLGHNDHRIVMALSILMTLTGGSISGTSAVKKSLPDFFDRLVSLGIKIEQKGDII